MYGRRSAGASFRDFLEAIMCTMQNFEFVRGENEPCAYFDKSRQVRTIHHVDDGRVAGPREGGPAGEVIKELGRYMLLKVSTPIENYDAYVYLGRKE